MVNMVLLNFSNKNSSKQRHSRTVVPFWAIRSIVSLLNKSTFLNKSSEPMSEPFLNESAILTISIQFKFICIMLFTMQNSFTEN